MCLAMGAGWTDVTHLYTTTRRAKSSISKALVRLIDLKPFKPFIPVVHQFARDLGVLFHRFVLPLWLGGLEIHFKSITDPFDMVGGEQIDVDAVFKHEYDQSTYSLFIGCGGCVPMVDPIVIPRMALNGYEHGEVEPFTQTTYRSVFPKAARKFNASDLLGCDQGHFGIRVVDHHNRSDGSQLIWGAVIGLGETFTFEELLSFPLFVLRNHGDTWNGASWSYWVILPLSLPLWWLLRSLRAHRGVYWLSPFDKAMRDEPRAWLYELAVVGFLAASLEMFVHLCYAQSMAAWGYQFPVGLFVVILFANGFPVIITIVTWRALYHRNDGWVTADWRWAPVEMLSAFSYLFLFGAGFYIGPIFVFLAALVRLVDEGLGWTAWRGWLTGRPTVIQVVPQERAPRSRSASPTFGALPGVYMNGV